MSEILKASAKNKHFKLNLEREIESRQNQERQTIEAEGTIEDSYDNLKSKIKAWDVFENQFKEDVNEGISDYGRIRALTYIKIFDEVILENA